MAPVDPALLDQQAAQLRAGASTAENPDLVELQAKQLEQQAALLRAGAGTAPAPAAVSVPPPVAAGADLITQAAQLEEQAAFLRSQQAAADAPPAEELTLDTLAARVAAIEAELHVR